MSSKPDKHFISGAEWAMRDMLICLVALFLSVAVMAFVMVPKSNDDTHAGKLIVQLYWDNKVDADVDLWVQGPNDHAVGYMARTGKVFDLLHDHLGFTNEGNYSNSELAIARNLPEGKYTINATLFKSYDGILPIHVWADIQEVKNGSFIKLFKVEGYLNANKEEITLINFRLSQDGNIIPGSQNSLLTRLWTR